jgi:hypothetical protein
MSLAPSTLALARELLRLSEGMRRNHARFNRPKSARSWHYPWSADCIIATNDKQLEITGAHSRFLIDRSVCICPHVLRTCSQVGLLKPLTSRFSWRTNPYATRSFR